MNTPTNNQQPATGQTEMEPKKMEPKKMEPKKMGPKKMDLRSESLASSIRSFQEASPSPFFV